MIIPQTNHQPDLY